MQTDHYRNLYERIWSDCPEYRGGQSNSVFNVRRFLEAIGSRRGSIIEFGSGEGYACLMFADEGFSPVTATDIAKNAPCRELLNDPRVRFVPGPAHEVRLPPADFVFNNDLLEHIPEALEVDTVKNIMDHCLDSAYFHIATGADSWGNRFGENLHINQKPFQSWASLLARFGSVRTLRNGGSECTVLVTKEAKK